jgi:dCMP deaminase
MTRPSWDEYFLDIAKVVSTRSQCLRAKHGAVIISKDNRILSTGYNNPPAGITGCEERCECIIVERPQYGPSCRNTVHAEMNALFHLGDRVGQAHKVYVTGTTCNVCLEHILKFGIKQIICGNHYNSEKGMEERQALLDAFGATIKFLEK